MKILVYLCSIKRALLFTLPVGQELKQCYRLETYSRLDWRQQNNVNHGSFVHFIQHFLLITAYAALKYYMSVALTRCCLKNDSKKQYMTDVRVNFHLCILCNCFDTRFQKHPRSALRRDSIIWNRFWESQSLINRF